MEHVIFNGRPALYQVIRDRKQKQKQKQEGH